MMVVEPGFKGGREELFGISVPLGGAAQINGILTPMKRVRIEAELFSCPISEPSAVLASAVHSTAGL